MGLNKNVSPDIPLTPAVTMAAVEYLSAKSTTGREESFLTNETPPDYINTGSTTFDFETQENVKQLIVNRSVGLDGSEFELDPDPVESEASLNFQLNKTESVSSGNISKSLVVDGKSIPLSCKSSSGPASLASAAQGSGTEGTNQANII